MYITSVRVDLLSFYVGYLLLIISNYSRVLNSSAGTFIFSGGKIPPAQAY